MVEMRSALVSSSPPSQGGTSSRTTPATRITASAPQTVFNDSKTNTSVASGDDDLAQALGGLTVRTQSEDPFLDPASAANQGANVSGLSPVASAFTPRDQEANAQFQTAFGNHALLGNTSDVQSFKQGTFTSEDDNLSRSIVVESQFTVTQRIKSLFKSISIPEDVYQIVLPVAGFHAAPKAMTLLEFEDPQLARVGFHALRLNLDSAEVKYCTPKVLTNYRGLDAGNTSNYEGELFVTALWDEINNPIPEHELYNIVYSSLTAFGPIKAFDRFAITQTRMRQFRVEFANIRSTGRALFQRHGMMTMGITLQWQAYQPDIIASNSGSSAVSPSQSVVPAAVGHAQPSLTGRSMMPSAAAMALTQFNPHAAPGRFPRVDNTISIATIEAGGDIRTTVMLRNIPNKVDCHMLKNLLDETSHGQYDFAYLRIDFQNQCNVGYAFINFSKAEHIVPFARARQRVRWNFFDSDKVAEISYATIQDRQNLIEKFRNSSVMLEHPDFRPKLFFTHPHPHAGREEQFPAPNNLQKMRRSIDNAETVGLLVPSRGSRGGGYNSRQAFPPPPRRGFHYNPPAQVTNSVGPRAHAYLNYQTRPRAIQNLITPPPTPFIMGSVNSRTVVPLNTAQDAFTDFRTIRAARHFS